MKVRELVQLLATAPQEAEVSLEGCDCTGQCVGWSPYDDRGSVGELVLLRVESGACQYDKLPMHGKEELT